MTSIERFVEVATRTFTDRQQPRALFEESVKNRTTTKIISYYGIGGIGKSRLLTVLQQELQGYIEKPIYVTVDFEESSFRNIGEFLNVLKFQLLAKERMDFYAFDLAYAMYWARTQPGEMPMEKAQTFVEEGHILFEILDSLDGIPYANLIPKAINLMSKIPSTTKKSKWWKEQGQILAAQLSTIQDLQTLRDILVKLWVQDVTTHFQKRQCPIVFFFDSFESLDLTRLPRVKMLMYEFPHYPALFIVGSRNKLNWENTEHTIVDEHLVGELSGADIQSFLQSCGILCKEIACLCQKRLEGTAEEKTRQCKKNHEEITKKIIKVTNGVPLYLDLMVDTYLQIYKERMPLPTDFTVRKEEMVEQLLKHFSEQEMAVFELLAFPNHWDFKIVQQLFKEYNPGIPLLQINRFYEYSFIQNEQPKHIVMQQYVRQWLLEKMEHRAPEYFKHVHETLFRYYENLCAANFSEALFLEVAYHGEKGLAREDFEQWLKLALQHMQNKGYTEGIIHYLQAKKIQLKDRGYFYALLLSCYERLGDVKQITLLATAAIDAVNELADASNHARIHAIIAAAFYAESDYEQAIKYFKLSIIHDERSYQAIYSYMKLGKIAVTLEDFDLARENYLQASTCIHHYLEQNEHDTALNSLAGQCFEKLGELLAYKNLRQEQLRLYKQSIHYLTLATTNKEAPNYLQDKTLLAFSKKRLAEAYEHQEGKEALVISTFQEAIREYEQVLHIVPFYVDTLEKLGHACADLLRVTRAYKKRHLMQQAFEKAQAAFLKVIDISPNQGSSLNRLSGIMVEMANDAIDHLEFSKVKLYLDEAIYYYQLTIERAPKYAYAASKKKEIELAVQRFEQQRAKNKH